MILGYVRPSDVYIKTACAHSECVCETQRRNKERVLSVSLLHARLVKAQKRKKKTA